MIYLLYGSDTRRSQEKLNEIITEFRGKNPAFNVYRFDAEESDPAEVKNALETRSLFAAKKLVVIKYPSQALDHEKLHAWLKNAKGASDSTLILWDRALDAKTLSEITPFCRKIQEFREIKKPPLPESNIFRLGDTFFTSRREGLRNLLSLLHQGHDDFNLFSYLANHARTLLTVQHYLENKKSVHPRHGIHPFVIKKASAIIRTIPFERLRRMFQRFFEEDYKVKVGISKPRDSLFHMIFREKTPPF